MQRNSGNSRAQIEQARRQHAFYQRQVARAAQEKSDFYDTGSGGFFSSDFSEYKMRRIAPFAALIYLLTILFLFSWLITKRQNNVGNFSKPNTVTDLPKINITQAGLYHFEAYQNFSSKTPQFSELELEIIDEDYNHVYSVYKDLWQEKYPTGNGGRLTYKDLKVKFDLELNKPGLYYLRTVSHNNNSSPITCKVKKKIAGSLYFGFYAIICLVLCAILIIGSAAWGTPAMMMRSLKKSRPIKSNKLFINVARITMSIYALCLIFRIIYYGYQSTGQDSSLPTQFLSKDKTIYLG